MKTVERENRGATGDAQKGRAMTHLAKPVKRSCRIEPKGGRGNHLDVVVTLYPGAVIGLRDKGRRKEYTLPLSTVYYLAA